MPSHLSYPYPLRVPTFSSSLPHPPRPSAPSSCLPTFLYYPVLPLSLTSTFLSQSSPSLRSLSLSSLETLVRNIPCFLSLIFKTSPSAADSWSLLPHGIPSPPVPPPLSHRPAEARRSQRARRVGARGSQRAWRVGGGRLRAPRGPPAPRQPPRAVQAGGTWPLPVSLLGRRGPDRGPCLSHSALRFSSPAAAEVAAGFLSRCLRRAMEKSSSCESLGSQPAVARPPSVDSLSR